MTPMERTEHHFRPFWEKDFGAISGGPFFSQPLCCTADAIELSTAGGPPSESWIAMTRKLEWLATAMATQVSHYRASSNTISCDAPYSTIGFRGKLFCDTPPPMDHGFQTQGLALIFELPNKARKPPKIERHNKKKSSKISQARKSEKARVGGSGVLWLQHCNSCREIGDYEVVSANRQQFVIAVVWATKVKPSWCLPLSCYSEGLPQSCQQRWSCSWWQFLGSVLSLPQRCLSQRHCSSQLQYAPACWRCCRHVSLSRWKMTQALQERASDLLCSGQWLWTHCFSSTDMQPWVQRSRLKWDVRENVPRTLPECLY